MNKNEPVGSMPAVNWIISASRKNSMEWNRDSVHKYVWWEDFAIVPYIKIERFMRFMHGPTETLTIALCEF